MARGGAVRVWSLKVFNPLHVLPTAAAVHALAFNHNGKMLAAAGADGMVRLYDLNARTQIMGWPAHPG
jgi:WD40 repeat protein